MLWQKIKRGLLRLLRAFAIAYLCVLLIMVFLERSLIYPVPELSRADWSPGAAFEDVQFASEDGTKLHGWYYEHAQPRRAILYFHGNGEQVADNADLISLYSEQFEASVFLFDYRGYGKSEGKPAEPGIVADGLAAQRWLAERTERSPDQVVLIGRSIGGGVAVACAAELGAEALVLQSTFARLTDTAAHHMPWLPVRWLMHNRYDSLARIQKYDGPLLASHGTADRVVPIEHGKQLFDASPSASKQFISFDGGGHNDPQPPSYYGQLQEFLEGEK